MVSIGVTAMMASAVPAPRPQSSIFMLDMLPSGFCSLFLSVSKARKREATLGTEK